MMMHRLAGFTAWLALMLPVCLAGPCDAAAKRPAIQLPLWSADVIQNASGVGKVPPYHANQTRRASLNRPGLSFLDNAQLAVYWVDVNAGQLSSRETPDISSPFRLRLSVVEASSGKITAKKEWGTRSRDTSLHVTSGGVAIRSGDLLRLCSRDLTELRQISLSQAPYEGWELRVSASGRTVLLNHYHINRQEHISVSRFEELDGVTYKTRLSWSQSPAIIGEYEITDEIIAATRSDGTVIAAEFGSAVWNPLFRASNSVCSPGLFGQFTTENLLICGWRDLVVSTMKGEVLMTAPFTKREGQNSQIVVAQNGQFAVAMLENFKDIWDTGGHITSLLAAVYDLSTRKRVMTVPVNPPPKHDYDVALSPDGSKLAILNDRVVSVYSVPTPVATDLPPTFVHVRIRQISS